MLVGQLIVSMLLGALVALAVAIAGLGAVGAVVAYVLAAPATLLVFAVRIALLLPGDAWPARGRTTARSG